MRLGVISRFSLSRKGLCALLASSRNFSIVLDLPAIPEDLEVLRKAQAEILLFHTSGDDAEFEAVSRLRKLAPEIKVLLLLDSAEEEIQVRAIRAGGRGCVLNASDLDVLVKALGAVKRGEIWVNRRIASQLITKLLQTETPEGPATNGLTPQERKVLALLATGSRNKEIASRLSVSENTIKTHLYTIYRKINADCRLAATLYYFQHVKSSGKGPHKPAAPAPPPENDDLPSDPDKNTPAE